MAVPAPGSVYQIAFVVDDRDAAIERWVADGAGPFWLFDDFAFEEVIAPSGAVSPRFDIALGFSGDINIEIMQVREDPLGLFPAANLPQPHHFARLTTDIEAEVAQAEAPLLLLHGRFPTGTPAAYLDTRATHGMITELVTCDETVAGMLAAMREAARDWDGSDARRRF